MNKKIILLFFIFIKVVECLRGNVSTITPVNTAIPEQIYVHFDRDFYTAGADIWYKIYFLNPENVSSRIVHIDILNTEGQAVLYQQHKIRNNTAYGDIHIPSNWKEDNYLIRVYTLYNLNFGSNYIYKKLIPVYNSSGQNTTVSSNTSSNLPAPIKEQSSDISSLTINLRQNKSAYIRREKVTLEIALDDKNGKPTTANLSLRAIHKKLTPDVNRQSILQLKKYYEHFEADIPDELLYQAQDSLQLTAKVLDAKTLKPVTSNLMTAYFPDSQKNSLFSSTDEAFTISLPPFNGKKVIQFFDYYPNHKCIPQIEVIPISEMIEKEVQTLPQLQKSPVVVPYLNHMLKVNKIDNIFNRTSFLPQHLPFTFSYHLKADHSFIVDDYHSMGTFLVFVREAGYAYVRTEKTSKNKPTIRLLGEHKERFNDPPLYMINNYLTDNEQLIFKLPLNEIEKIELFTMPEKLENMFLGTYTVTNFKEINQTYKRFYSIAQNGVLGVQTYNKQIPEAILTAPNNILMTGFPINRDFAKNHQDNFEKNNTRIPEFLSLAYWNPEIMTDENGKARITFYTSDLLGDFLIEVEGITPTGEIVEGEIKYSVLK